MLHEPQLLLLDEPTAGVDPRRAATSGRSCTASPRSGISVLVSTHYMDEAERCHKLAYIAYGKLLAQGTAERRSIDVAGPSHLGDSRATTSTALAEQLRTAAGRRADRRLRLQRCMSAAAIAAALRALDRAARGGRTQPLRIERIATGPRRRASSTSCMGHSEDNFGAPSDERARCFSVARWWGIVLKEFLQLRRDRAHLRA